MVHNCQKVRGHKLEALLQKGRQFLATAPLSTLGCPFSEMRKAARERLVGGNLVRHRLAADSGRERERERAESAGALLAYNPPCVTTTPLPASQDVYRRPREQIRPRGTGILGLLHQSEQSSKQKLSWKISSKPSLATAQRLKWSSMKTGARLRQIDAKKDSKHGKGKSFPTLECRQSLHLSKLSGGSHF